MATDNFNRADETPIAAPWTKVGSGGTFNVISNALQKTVVSDDSAYYYAGAAAGADQYAEATQVAKPTGNDWGPAVRVSGTTQINMYCFDSYITDRQIFKEVNSVYSGITHAGNDVSVDGDLLRLEASGTSLSAYINGALISSGTDTSFSSGQPGIFIYEGGGGVSGGVWDDWAGGDLGGVPTPMRPTLELVNQAVQRGSRG